MMVLALQGALLMQHSTSAVADAFCASRLDGQWGMAFGMLPANLDHSWNRRASPRRRELNR
jgi:putative acyl-CoA dehydrogenase